MSGEYVRQEFTDSTICFACLFFLANQVFDDYADSEDDESCDDCSDDNCEIRRVTKYHA